MALRRRRSWARCVSASAASAGEVHVVESFRSRFVPPRRIEIWQPPGVPVRRSVLSVPRAAPSAGWPAVQQARPLSHPVHNTPPPPGLTPPSRRHPHAAARTVHARWPKCVQPQECGYQRGGAGSWRLKPRPLDAACRLTGPTVPLPACPHPAAAFRQSFTGVAWRPDTALLRLGAEAAGSAALRGDSLPLVVAAWHGPDRLSEYCHPLPLPCSRCTRPAPLLHASGANRSPLSRLTAAGRSCSFAGKARPRPPRTHAFKPSLAAHPGVSTKAAAAPPRAATLSMATTMFRQVLFGAVCAVAHVAALPNHACAGAPGSLMPRHSRRPTPTPCLPVPREGAQARHRRILLNTAWPQRHRAHGQQHGGRHQPLGLAAIPAGAARPTGRARGRVDSLLQSVWHPRAPRATVKSGGPVFRRAGGAV
jgi:hypothetical protein